MLKIKNGNYGKMPWVEQVEININDCISEEEIKYFMLLYNFNFKKRTDYNTFHKSKLEGVYFVYHSKYFYINLNYNPWFDSKNISKLYSLTVNYSTEYQILHFKMGGHDIHLDNKTLDDINQFLNDFLKVKIRNNKVKCLIEK